MDSGVRWLDLILFITGLSIRFLLMVVRSPPILAGHYEGFPDSFKQLYNKVYDYILTGDISRTPNFPTFADGHYEMQLRETIARSAREKAWVKVR